MSDSTFNSPTQLRGKLLLADPVLRGSIFHRSVILLHNHDATQGAMGLILNQPSGKLVGDLRQAPELTIRQPDAPCLGRLLR